MPDLVLRRVTLVDVDAERILPDRTIEITGPIISGIRSGAALPDPPDCPSVVDCAGAFVLPGLVDAHVHLENLGEALLFVVNGVTAVRNMDGSPLHLAMARAFGDGQHLAPTVVTTSPIVDGRGPHGYPTVPHAVLAPEPAGVPAFVAGLAARGYRQVKVYDRLTAEQHRAVCAAADRHRIPVTGHCPRSLTFEAAIEHGQVCFEHLTGITRGRLRPAPPSAPEPTGVERIVDAARRVDLESVAALGAMMRDRGIRLCPTTTVLRPPLPLERATGEADGSSVDPVTRSPTDYLGVAFRQGWRPPRTVTVGGVRVPWARYAEAMEEWNEALLSCLAVLLAEGVSVLAGTDYPAPGTVPGFALHEELRRLVDLGLTPWRALRAATSDAARFLGTGADQGRLAPGCRADLVILGSDPTRDIGALVRPLGVVLRGRHLDRAQLDALLASRLPATTPARPVVRIGVSRPVVRPEVTGELVSYRGGYQLEQGSFQHRPVASGWVVTERWTGPGQDRERTADLVLAPDGVIVHGQLRSTWGFASSRTCITRAGAYYQVRHVAPDGVVEEHRIAGPLLASERVCWSAFAAWLDGVSGGAAGCTGGLSPPGGDVPVRLWDGQDQTCAATYLPAAGGEVAVRRATEATRLAVRTVAGEISVDSTSQGGQRSNERRLVLRGQGGPAPAAPVPVPEPVTHVNQEREGHPMILLNVGPGEEVIETLIRRAAEHGVVNGAVVSLIGAVDSCVISMPGKDGADVTTEHVHPFDLTGTGEFRDGKPHLHVVLGRDGDAALMGHLRRASVERLYVHAYVQPLSTR